MTRRLGEGTWTDHWKPSRRPLLVVPIGSCEQHGPHLPLDTDTRIASALANSLVNNYDEGELLLCPALTITASAEHASFPGTLSLGATVFEQVIIELVRSADWAAGVVLVNGHGGNHTPVERAVRLLQNEQRRVMSWWPKIPDGDAHAGHTETSMMLAISPQLVRMDDADAGRMEPIAELIDEIRKSGIGAVSPNGVLGDPRMATATHGRSLLTRLSIDLVSAVDEWWD
jgi:mycofactocin precursor peptide peptidase